MIRSTCLFISVGKKAIWWVQPTLEMGAHNCTWTKVNSTWSSKLWHLYYTCEGVFIIHLFLDWCDLKSTITYQLPYVFHTSACKRDANVDENLQFRLRLVVSATSLFLRWVKFASDSLSFFMVLPSKLDLVNPWAFLLCLWGSCLAHCQ